VQHLVVKVLSNNKSSSWHRRRVYFRNSLTTMRHMEITSKYSNQQFNLHQEL